jgi:hypothetical protein
MKLSDFPNETALKRFEGGVVYTAERGGMFYVITDESTMADLLSDEDLQGIELLKTYEFSSADERLSYLESRAPVGAMSASAAARVTAASACESAFIEARMRSAAAATPSETQAGRELEKPMVARVLCAPARRSKRQARSETVNDAAVLFGTPWLPCG